MNAIKVIPENLGHCPLTLRNSYQQTYGLLIQWSLELEML